MDDNKHLELEMKINDILYKLNDVSRDFYSFVSNIQNGLICMNNVNIDINEATINNISGDLFVQGEINSEGVNVNSVLYRVEERISHLENIIEFLKVKNIISDSEFDDFIKSKEVTKRLIQ